ncbi:MAG: ATP-binding protein, partial [Mycobacterium leprae]
LTHAITAFATLFTRRDRDVFKLVVLDEAWSVLGSSQGKGMVTNLLRTGRAMNSAVYIITQNCADLLDETIRNNLGLKFVMRSQDAAEIAAVLELLGLEPSPENVSAVRSLETGTALLQDVEGRVGAVRLDAVLPHLSAAFDTRPPVARTAP